MINETSSNKHLSSSIKTHQDSETEKAYRLMRTAPDSQKKEIRYFNSVDFTKKSTFALLFQLLPFYFQYLRNSTVPEMKETEDKFLSEHN